MNIMRRLEALERSRKAAWGGTFLVRWADSPPLTAAERAGRQVLIIGWMTEEAAASRGWA